MKTFRDSLIGNNMVQSSDAFLTRYSTDDRLVYLAKSEYTGYDDAMSVRVFCLDCTLKLLHSDVSTATKHRALMALRVLFDEVDCQFSGSQYEVFLNDLKQLFDLLSFSSAEPWLKKRLTLSSYVVLKDILSDVKCNVINCE